MIENHADEENVYKSVTRLSKNFNGSQSSWRS